ncbi:MAG: acylneuraminate cytidylyltransferase family protein [Oligoflexia bacterium]|nr:acylneuraminate cytidylyltransferase family protein [Oligoflexia bacterium]
MFNNMKIFALVPARAGSKGIPQKNITPLAGRPLILWTIDAAVNSRYIDTIILSTDDSNIAKVASHPKVTVPFLRPSELAADSSSLHDVIDHTLNWFDNKSIYFDIIVLLQPTSPLRTTEDIDSSIEQFCSSMKSKNETLISVYQMPNKISWLLKEKNEQFVEYCFKDEIELSRQDIKQRYYLPNGAIYMARTDCYVKHKTFFGEEMFFYSMDEKKSIDIDTIEDLEIAETFIKNIKG